MSENAKDIKILGDCSLTIEGSLEKTVSIMNSTADVISSLSENSIKNAGSV